MKNNIENKKKDEENFSKKIENKKIEIDDDIDLENSYKESAKEISEENFGDDIDLNTPAHEINEKNEIDATVDIDLENADDLHEDNEEENLEETELTDEEVEEENLEETEVTDEEVEEENFEETELTDGKVEKENLEETGLTDEEVEEEILEETELADEKVEEEILEETELANEKVEEEILEETELTDEEVEEENCAETELTDGEVEEENLEETELTDGEVEEENLEETELTDGEVEKENLEETELIDEEVEEEILEKTELTYEEVEEESLEEIELADEEVEEESLEETELADEKVEEENLEETEVTDEEVEEESLEETEVTDEAVEEENLEETEVTDEAVEEENLEETEVTDEEVEEEILEETEVTDEELEEENLEETEVTDEAVEEENLEETELADEEVEEENLEETELTDGEVEKENLAETELADGEVEKENLAETELADEEVEEESLEETELIDEESNENNYDNYNYLDEDTKRKLQENAYFKFINNLDECVNDKNTIKKLEDFSSDELVKMSEENPALYDYLKKQNLEKEKAGMLYDADLETMSEEDKCSKIEEIRNDYYRSTPAEQKLKQEIAYREFIASGKGINENNEYKTFENMNKGELAKMSEENPALLDYLNNEYQKTHDARVLPDYINSYNKNEVSFDGEVRELQKNTKGELDTLDSIKNISDKERKRLLRDYLVQNANKLRNLETNENKTIGDYSVDELDEMKKSSPIYYAYLKGQINKKGEWIGNDEIKNVIEENENSIDVSGDSEKVYKDTIEKPIVEVKKTEIHKEISNGVEKIYDEISENINSSQKTMDLSKLSNKEIKMGILNYLMDRRNLNNEMKIKTLSDYSKSELENIKNDNPIVYAFLNGDIDKNGKFIEKEIKGVETETNKEIRENNKDNNIVGKISNKHITNTQINNQINNKDSFSELNLNVELKDVINTNPVMYENAVNKYYRNINNYDSKLKRYKTLVDYSFEEQKKLFNDDKVLYYALANEYKKNNPDYEFPVYSDIAKEKKIFAIKEEVEKLTSNYDDMDSLDGKRLVNAGLDKISGKLENSENRLEDNEINLIIAKAEGLTTDKYLNGKDVAKEYKELSLYTDHGIEHVKKVANKSIEIARTFKECDYDYKITKEDEKELLIAAMYHDTGMDGEWVEDSVSDDITPNGNHIRKDHPVNSAIHVLSEREKLKSSFNITGSQVNNVALYCLMHSKSASGVKNISSKRQWADAINKLCSRSRKAGIDCNIEDFDIIKKGTEISKDNAGNYVVRPTDIDSDKLNKYAMMSGCLRLGDANAVEHPMSQTGENIDIKRGDRILKTPVDLYDECITNKVFYGNNEVEFDANINTADNISALNSKMYNLGESNISTYVKTKEVAGNKILEEVIVVEDALLSPGATLRCINERFDELDSLRGMQTAFTVEIHGIYTPEEKEKIREMFKHGIKAHKASIGKVVKDNNPKVMKAVKSRSSIIDNVVFVQS